MSETIVNRVHVTPHLAAEIAKLHAVGAVANPVLQTADAQRAGQVGTIELEEKKEVYPPLPSIKEMVKDIPELKEAIDSGLGNSIIARGEFEKFKKEVIAAFKHLGLDTRKHFS